jgi:hypothetical protein
MKRLSTGRSTIRPQSEFVIFSEGTFLIAIGATILLAAVIAAIAL